MPLTATQQSFLNRYVRKHPIRGKLKKSRASAYTKIRDEVEQALQGLPRNSDRYGTVRRDMDAADRTADEGDFKIATKKMQDVLLQIQDAIKAFDPLPVINGLHPLIDQIKNSANGALAQMVAMDAFVSPAGGAALRTQCASVVANAPAPGGDPAAWAAAMKAHMNQSAAHVAACESALADVDARLLAIKNNLAIASQNLGKINADVDDVFETCKHREPSHLWTLTTRLKTEIFEVPAFNRLKTAPNGKQFVAYDSLVAPYTAERSALVLALNDLKGKLNQWRASLSESLTRGQQGRDPGTQREQVRRAQGLGHETLDTLIEDSKEFDTGKASEKGPSSKPRRSDGIVTFDSKSFFSDGGLPAYSPPTDEQESADDRAAQFGDVAKAQLIEYLQQSNIAPDSQEMFELSLRSIGELRAEYVLSMGWDPKNLSGDQALAADAVARGMFAAVRELCPDKLVTMGPSPKLEMQGKTYGSPEIIGTGGFGVVRRYKCETDDSYVVVKSMSVQGRDSDEKEQKRKAMVREVLVHKYLMTGDDEAEGRANVVEMKSAVIDEAGDIHVVMELVEGGDLDDNRMGMMVAVETDAIPEEARSVLQQSTVRQAIQGLIYLRDQNVVHFDVKGANIMLTDEGQVKLADFGSSSVGTQQDGTTSINRGDVDTSPGYDGGSPRDKPTDDRFDMYAMAKVINVMQANASDPKGSWHDSEDAVLTGAIKRLTEAMTSSNPDDRPTLESVLKSSYLQNVENYDPDLVKQLQAKSVAYTKALKQEIATLRDQIPADIKLKLTALKPIDRIGSTDVLLYCRKAIKRAREEADTQTATRDDPAKRPSEKFDAQRVIDSALQEIERLEGIIGLFGKSPQAQQIAAEMKDLSTQLTRGTRDPANDEGDMVVLVDTLKRSHEDPAGFVSVIGLPAYRKLFRSIGIDDAKLATLASAFHMDLDPDNKKAVQQLMVLSKDIRAFVDSMPAEHPTVKQLGRGIADGLNAVHKGLMDRLKARKT